MALIGRAFKLGRMSLPLFALTGEGGDGPPAAGDLALITADPALRATVAAALGQPTGDPAGALLTIAVPADPTDAAALAPALVARRAAGKRVLAVVAGSREHRRALVQVLTRDHRLELSDLVHIPALDEAGVEEVQQAVARTLGDDAVAVARHVPVLRPAVGARLVEEASRRAAVVGALPLGGADLPALMLIQLRLAGRLAAAHDRPRSLERLLEAGAIIAAAFGWRAIGRSVVKLLPVAGWAGAGAVAYGATRAMGAAALARLTAGHDPIEAGPLEQARPQIDRLLARVARREDGAQKEFH